MSVFDKFTVKDAEAHLQKQIWETETPEERDRRIEEKMKQLAPYVDKCGNAYIQIHDGFLSKHTPTPFEHSEDPVWKQIGQFFRERGYKVAHIYGTDNSGVGGWYTELIAVWTTEEQITQVCGKLMSIGTVEYL